jgi:predicted short-subunit dehydrogenase-like oxidoreductase (DUF2520 family)
MKKAQLVGLIAAGNLTDSALTRFTWLSVRLGPVKSGSYRVASRIANMLRAGHPVKDFAEFESCSLILISVPDGTVSYVVSEMLSSGISWRHKAVVLCSAWLASSDLRDLAACGASVGSLCPIPGWEDERYLVEGDTLAMREAKSLVESRTHRAVTIDRHLKPLYLAALTCTNALLFALLRVTFESLRHAGIPAASSDVLIERQMARTLRSFLKSGNRAYPVPHELPRQIRALASVSPELAHYFEQSCRLAARLMERRPNHV